MSSLLQCADELMYDTPKCRSSERTLGIRRRWFVTVTRFLTWKADQKQTSASGKPKLTWQTVPCQTSTLNEGYIAYEIRKMSGSMILIPSTTLHLTLGRCSRSCHGQALCSAYAGNSVLAYRGEFDDSTAIGFFSD